MGFSACQWLPMVKEYACNMHPGDSLCIDARPMLAVTEMLRASLVVQRLLGTRGVFESVKSNPDFIGILIKALKHPSSVVAFAAANTIRAAIKHYSADSPAPDSPAAARASSASSFLMQAWPAHAEAANKHVVLSGDNLQVLVARLQTDALVHQNALQVQGILEILTLALHLPPSSDAEAEKHWMEFPSSPSMPANSLLFPLNSLYSAPPLTSNALLIKTIFTRCSPAFITRFRAVILLHAAVLPLLFNKLERARERQVSLDVAAAEERAVQQAGEGKGQQGAQASSISPSFLPHSLPSIQAVILSRAVVLLLLKNALFNKLERARDVSAELLFLIAESDAKTQQLLANLLPKEAAKAAAAGGASSTLASGLKIASAVAAAAAAAATASTTTGTTPGSGSAGGEGSGGAVGMGGGSGGVGSVVALGVWKEALEMLRRRSITTPVLVWNDAKRHELHAYLKEQVEAFDAALGRTGGGKDIHFNTDDCECCYTPASNDNDVCKAIVEGVHLEVLLQPSDDSSPALAAHWKLDDPAALFTATLQALLLCSTPLYGTCVQDHTAHWKLDNPAVLFTATLQALLLCFTPLTLPISLAPSSSCVPPFSPSSFPPFPPHPGSQDVCKTIVEGVHLEVLLQPSDDSSPALAAHWKLDDPAALFTATLQALLLCFTPLYGTCELPEIEPRLAVDALTWMYERHEGEIRGVVENLLVVEWRAGKGGWRGGGWKEEGKGVWLAVDALTWMYERHEGEIRGVVDHPGEMGKGGGDGSRVGVLQGQAAVSQFVKAGGMSIILPLMINSDGPTGDQAGVGGVAGSLQGCCKDETLFECDSPLCEGLRAIEVVLVVGADGECCKDETLFECDAPSVKDRGAIEVVPVVGADGEVRMARVPSGRQAKEGGASTVHHGGSVEARDAIKWQDESVPEKLQLGMALELLETVLDVEARDAIKWQDESVPEKLQLGMALEVLETVLDVDSRDAIKWQDENAPEKLQLGMALELLETVLDVIEVPGGLERYPPPLPLEDLARPELLCSLVHLLLRAKSPTFRSKQAASELHTLKGPSLLSCCSEPFPPYPSPSHLTTSILEVLSILILEVLSILCRGNKQAASELCRFGCFPMLLWKVVAGDISHDDRTRILKFLARTHLLQVGGPTTCREASALEHAPVKGLLVEHLSWHESTCSSSCLTSFPTSLSLQDPSALEHAPVKGLLLMEHLPWHESILLNLNFTCPIHSACPSGSWFSPSLHPLTGPICLGTRA
ncbi:unnamed protein product, partial [Closterium sp. Naga37s-1]